MTNTSGVYCLVSDLSPDSMKYFEVEERERNKWEDTGEQQPAVVDVIPENHHRTDLIPHTR